MRLQDYKILILDDHFLSLKLMGMQLMQFGFSEENIVSYLNGKEALQAFESTDYNIAIIDWDMPDIDGLEFMRRCKESGHTQTAFVMISAEAQPERILHALNSGVISYLTKPISQIDVNEQIPKVLKWIENRNR